MNERSFLLIRMSSLGDVILTGSVVSSLREKFPEARIDFVVRKESADMIRHHPALTETIQYDVKTGRKGLKELKANLAKRGYDTVIDLHGNMRSAYLRNLPGVTVRKIEKHRFIRFLLVKLGINLYRRFYGVIPRVPEKYYLAAREAGNFPEKTELYITDDAKKQGENLLAKYKKGVVSIAPGARHFTKRWPAESYASLIRLIREKTDMECVLLGGPDEVGVILKIQSLLGSERIPSFAGEISLLETIGVIGASQAFVSNDSALMHAAAAFQIPQIAIFGSTVEELGFFPVSPVAKVVENRDLRCRPCTHIGRSSCPRKHFACMKGILSEEVFSELQSILKKGL